MTRREMGTSQGQKGVPDLLGIHTSQKEGSLHSEHREREWPSLPGGGDGLEAAILGRMYLSMRERVGPPFERYRERAHHIPAVEIAESST